MKNIVLKFYVQNNYKLSKLKKKKVSENFFKEKDDRTLKSIARHLICFIYIINYTH